VRFLRPATEEEMIATFLRGEIDSSRYGETIRAALARDGRADRLIRSPAIDDHDENAYRSALLEE
jgi:hypothetical protein